MAKSFTAKTIGGGKLCASKKLITSELIVKSEYLENNVFSIIIKNGIVVRIQYNHTPSICNSTLNIGNLGASSQVVVDDQPEAVLYYVLFGTIATLNNLTVVFYEKVINQFVSLRSTLKKKETRGEYSNMHNKLPTFAPIVQREQHQFRE